MMSRVICADVASTRASCFAMTVNVIVVTSMFTNIRECNTCKQTNEASQSADTHFHVSCVYGDLSYLPQLPYVCSTRLTILLPQPPKVSSLAELVSLAWPSATCQHHCPGGVTRNLCVCCHLRAKSKLIASRKDAVSGRCQLCCPLHTKLKLTASDQSVREFNSRLLLYGATKTLVLLEVVIAHQICRYAHWNMQPRPPPG